MKKVERQGVVVIVPSSSADSGLASATQVLVAVLSRALRRQMPENNRRTGHNRFLPRLSQVFIHNSPPVI